MYSNKGQELYSRGLQRMQVNKVKRQKKLEEMSSFSFRPEIISQVEDVPFQTKYQKWLEKERQKQVKRKAALQQKQKKGLQECKFKPQIDNSIPIGKSFADRNREWQQRKQTKIKKQKEQQQKEASSAITASCTFKPQQTLWGNPQTKPDHKVTGIDTYLKRQQKARLNQRLKEYRNKNPNWHLWNHRPSQDDSQLQLMCRSTIIPKGSMTERATAADQ